MKDIRVLLIEDDQFRRCEVSLKKRGFTVMTAVDGEEDCSRQGQRPRYHPADMLMPKLSGSIH